MVVEYCANGSLESYLGEHREHFKSAIIDNNLLGTTEDGDYMVFVDEDFTQTTLIKWCMEIGNGLAFLHSKNV